MTRKRFIKLLMAKGYSRDGAAALADYAQMCGEPYAEAFQKVSTHELLNAFNTEAFAAVVERMKAMAAECIAVVAERLPIIMQSITENIVAIANALPKEGDAE